MEDPRKQRRSGYEAMTDQEVLTKYCRMGICALVISTIQPFYTILYKQDEGCIHKTLPKEEIGYDKTGQPNWSVLIKEVATITGTPYTDAASVYRSIQKNKRQEKPERFPSAYPQFYKDYSVDRSWSECYESDRGFVHEWPGFAKIFTMDSSDFQIKDPPAMGRSISLRKCYSRDIFTKLSYTANERPFDETSALVNKTYFYLAFKNIKDPAVQGFFKYMEEEYSVASLSYYLYCIRPGEALKGESSTKFPGHFQPTGSGKTRISSYLHPFEHLQGKEIQSAFVLHPLEKRLAGFAFSKNMEAIVYKEVLAFFENSHQAVLESDCHLPKVSVDLISEYIGAKGITKAELTLIEDEDETTIDEAFLKVGLKEMISMGRIQVTHKN